MSKRKSATIKANFRMLSAARDQDDAAEVSNDNGYKGGVATYAFLHVIKKPNKPTFGDILRRLAENFESMNLRQKPILSYSIKDLNPRFEPFFIGTTENKNSSGRGGKNYALLIGIKYTGTVLEKLEGTHEDVFRIKKMLLDEHGFSEGNIQVIVDDSKHTQPTSKNIWKALYDLVNTCKENDCVFFYFAGHGEQKTNIFSILVLSKLIIYNFSSNFQDIR